MAVDEDLRERVRSYLRGLDDVAEKGIVGGVGFTLRGNLACGVMGRDLLVRVGKREFEHCVSAPGARPMAMGGRSSRSWILVDGAVVGSPEDLAEWLDRAVEVVGTLPAR